MDASDGLAGRVLLLAAAGVVEHELVGGQRDRLADGLGREPLGKGLGDRLGGLLAVRGVDRLAQLLDPGVVRLAVSGRRLARVPWFRAASAGAARSVLGSASGVRLLVAAEPHRLAQQRVGVFLARQVEQAQDRQASTTRWTLMSSWTTYWRSL